YTCDGASGAPGAPDQCWAAVVQYLGCDIRTSPDPACGAAYTAASPAQIYSATGAPAFVANADDELLDLTDAEDLSARLGQLSVQHDLCIVEHSNLHGRAYLYVKACNTDPAPPAGPDVLDDTATFLHQMLGG